MPNSKMINGKRYTKRSGVGTKSEAQALAKKRRKRGYLVRVIPYKSAGGSKRYGIYQRGKEKRR